MREESTIHTKLLPDGHIVQVMPDGSVGPMKDDTEWERLKAMTDEEIELAARSDPDNPPLTDEELQQFEQVPDIKTIREHLHLSQEEFAAQFDLSLSTVQDWERGDIQPDRTARTLLKVIAGNPEAVRRALARQP